MKGQQKDPALSNRRRDCSAGHQLLSDFRHRWFLFLGKAEAADTGRSAAVCISGTDPGRAHDAMRATGIEILRLRRVAIDANSDSG